MNAEQPTSQTTEFYGSSLIPALQPNDELVRYYAIVHANSLPTAPLPEERPCPDLPADRAQASPGFRFMLAPARPSPTPAPSSDDIGDRLMSVGLTPERPGSTNTYSGWSSSSTTYRDPRGSNGYPSEASSYVGQPSTRNAAGSQPSAGPSRLPAVNPPPVQRSVSSPTANAGSGMTSSTLSPSTVGINGIGAAGLPSVMVQPPSPGLSTAIAECLDDELIVVRRTGGTPRISLGDADELDLIGWTELVHLDGSIYYWHKEYAILTTDDILSPGLPRVILAAVGGLKRRLTTGRAARQNLLTGNEHIVVRGIGSDEGPEMFFLDYKRGWYLEPVWRDRTGSTSSRPVPNHSVELVYEEKTERYWKEIEAFPMHLEELPSGAEADFLGALAFGASERILEWNETPFPFNEHQAERLLQVYMDLREAALRRHKVVPAQAWHIARVMSRIEASRKEHKHGTRDYMLYRAVAIDPPTWQVKLADVILAFVLLGVQRMYRIRLQSARVKGVVHAPGLRELFENFLDEWSDSNLLATVFVGADIGFLAVSNVDGLQRTALLASSVFSVMSVVSGVHHIWQHRTKVDASPEEASHYLTHAHGLGDPMDLSVVACFLAIPVASLLWSIITFGVALGAFCIQNTDTRGEILLAVALGLLGTLSIATLLFFWHIWNGPRREEISEEDPEERDTRGWKAAFSRQVKEIKEIVLGKKLLEKMPEYKYTGRTKRMRRDEESR